MQQVASNMTLLTSHMVTVYIWSVEAEWGRSCIRLSENVCTEESSGRHIGRSPPNSNIERKSVSHSVVSDSVWPHRLYPTSLLCPWDFSGKNTGVYGHFLLQGIVPTQDWTCISCISCIGRWILYHCTTWEAPIRTPDRSTWWWFSC